ncbi:hypothetical protein ABKN59_001808 [Abortiporus biennis]
MSILSWSERRDRLGTLLRGNGTEEDTSLALDRILHGQSVIGKTSKTTEIDGLRFGDKDLDIVGTLEYGQFGVIDVVTCKLDGRVYVRKSIEKRFALKTSDQCSPQCERDILLKARKSDTNWAPHLMCAFQTPTHLNLVMDYAEGGTLWDVLESSPHDGKILESDLAWWAPQVVSAVNWCHSQGFVHRDIKPHNFVLNSNAHVLLIDFGSAAPLLPPNSDGSQQVPKRHCLVPCGTCDYISPEILEAHEAALVALEMDDEPGSSSHDDTIGGYGRETDWWSLGAMFYEMVCGVAPFFANDIRQTYAKIMDHNRSLRFNNSVSVSDSLKDLLRRFLTSAELRLGRCGIQEIKDHPFFRNVEWDTLSQLSPPDGLHLPQFTYTTPVPTSVPTEQGSLNETESRAFAFSALFQSSPMSSPGITNLSSQKTPTQPSSSRSILREQVVASFIGFSWGPPADAFSKPLDSNTEATPNRLENFATPRPLRQASLALTPFGLTPHGTIHMTPSGAQRYPFATPIRPSLFTPHGTLPRASTIRRTAPRRTVSDREAMKQLVDCVGMSARKKVLESGRKPRILSQMKFGSGGSGATGSLGRARSGSGTLKELRFDKSVMVVSNDGVTDLNKLDFGSGSTSSSMTMGNNTSAGSVIHGLSMSLSTIGPASEHQLSSIMSVSEDDSFMSEDSDIPPSPSPSPRPGSAMSMMSRRSQTPTITGSGSYFLRTGSRSIDSRGLPSPTLPLDPTWNGNTINHPPPVSVQSRPQSERRQRSVTTTTNEDLSYEVLDQYDKRYQKLMREILDIGGRLDEVVVKIDTQW